MSWQYLSYPLNDQTFGYANGTRFELTKIRSMCCGDTSNNSAFSMPTHFGTHIDFPFHFSDGGKTSSNYSANDLVFNAVACLDISEFIISDLLIMNHHLDLSNIDANVELLIIKTGFCTKRNEYAYWEKGWGFHPETAQYLKSNLLQLKAIAFDLISLTSFQNREIGRVAHNEFLMKNDILIIEDLDLRSVTQQSKFNQIIVACLQLENADGAPCTIFAETDGN